MSEGRGVLNTLLKDLPDTDASFVRVIDEFLSGAVAVHVAERVLEGRDVRECLSSSDIYELGLHAECAAAYDNFRLYKKLRYLTGAICQGFGRKSRA